ncbi:MAG: CopG family transcriptional regulator [Dehalococcoidia bacterium]
MPSITLYLNDDTLNAVKSRAAGRAVAMSNIVQEAVEEYLKREEKQEAKRRVLETLKASSFGGIVAWEEFHRERSSEDDCRA